MIGFGKKNQLSEIQKPLSSAAELLRESCRNAEPAFIAIGTELETIYAAATRLTQQTIGIIHLITGESQEESILSKVASVAENSFSELKSRQSSVSDNLESIISIIRHLSELHEICSVVEKIALFLRIIGLNMDIECSRYPESAELFGFVTRDIRMLSDSVLSVVQNIRNDTDIARFSQMSACQEIRKDSEVLTSLSEDAEKAIRDAVRNIEIFTELSVKAIQQIGNYSQVVSEHVADLVVAIQFHDSMSQRIEHIVKAIEDIKQLPIESGGKETRQKYLGTAHAIIELQINHIGHIMSESDSVYQKSIAAFEQIGAEVAVLPQSLSTLGKGNMSDPLTGLIEALSCLRHLLGQGRHLLNKIQETTDHATETTDRLSAYLKRVRDFSFQTQLIALNSVIKAAHIGTEGATLEILAQEMKGLSEQANDFAANVEGLLGQITFETQELKRRALQISKDVGKARASLDSNIIDISNAYERFKRETEDISGHSEMLRQSVEKASAGLVFLPKLTEEINECFQQLEHIDRILVPFAAQDIDDLSDEFEKIGKRYTMKKERDIHVQTVKDDHTEISDKTDKTAEDFGKNVELF
jgi:methyl-accepting chemotaxis protein